MKTISRIRKNALRRWLNSASRATAAIPPRGCRLEPLEHRVLFSIPAAPLGVSAANGATSTDLLVNWTASSGATSYQVWRGTTANSASATDIAPNVTGTTSFDDSSSTDSSPPTVGTTYFYWVIASNSSGNSGFSTIASATAGTLVFGDTFGSAGISSAWGAENATDPNNGNVHYTNTSAANGTASNPTTLAVVADSQATNGQALAMSLLPAPGHSGTYDSAEISTKIDPSGLGNSLQYGEITARIKMPGGSNSNAIWPAFWMLGDNISSVGWPNCGEIDIMENRGSQPGTNYSTLHGPANGGGDYNGGSGVGVSDTLSGGQSFYTSYHVFSANWGPNSVTFSVDGTVVGTVNTASVAGKGSWVFNGHPFYIILDVCEGGPFAPGTITSTQTMSVDYVRAYSLPAPTNILAAAATSTQKAVVSWNPVVGATSYEVWRNSTNNSSTATELNSFFTGTTYTDNSSQTGVNYYYFLVAVNASQTSNFSAGAYTGRAASTVTLASPSGTNYDGTSDVTNWAVATVHGVSGSPAPTGSATLTYYNGSTPTGTPLASPPINLGTYTVVANYAGDSNYLPSQSSPVTFAITNPVGLVTASGAQYTITWAAGTPTLDITAGAVTFNADLSTTFANYVLTIESGASVLLNTGQHVSQLQLLGTAVLDMAKSSLFINYGAAPDPIASVAAWINTGYDGGAWDGTGIISSTAKFLPTTGIGYADAADVGNPASLVTGQLEIRYTLLGDANLDGAVNGSDFAILASNFNKAVSGWDQGDFNYDGAANGADFALLAANFNQGIQTSVAVNDPITTVSAPVTATTSTSTAPQQSSLQTKPVKVKKSHHRRS